jgi:NAD(P)-dependent dehydrogenase (short-subunit alcohol dehydrogenase family)
MPGDPLRKLLGVEVKAEVRSAGTATLGSPLPGNFIEMTASHDLQEIAVVTGASTGMGAATARELARRGFHVLAGVRRDRDADAIRRPGIEPLIIDITNPDHIRALATRVHGDPQGRAVRALVNNAAIQANVPIEAFAIDEWRRMFEVNLFGHIAVTQALLPALIRSKGRVVNISSVGGKIAMATYGPYAATKFALEAASDSLRREMAPFGVGVVVVEPGAVRTEMLGRAIATGHELVSAMTPEQRWRYGGLVQAVNSQAVSSTESGLPADAAAKVIAKAVTARKPRTRYTIGRDAALLTRLTRILPDRTLDRVLAAALRPHFPNESNEHHDSATVPGR